MADVLRATFPKNKREPLKRALLQYYFAEQSLDEIKTQKPATPKRQKRLPAQEVKKAV